MTYRRWRWAGVGVRWGPRRPFWAVFVNRPRPHSRLLAVDMARGAGGAHVVGAGLEDAGTGSVTCHGWSVHW